MKPIDYGMFNYHAETFPPELRQASYSSASSLTRAIDEARLVLAKFDAFRASTMADRRLSPTGKRGALREWTEAQLPALRSCLEKASEQAAAAEESAVTTIMRGQIEKPTEVADVALAQEVRTYFRNIQNDLARSDALRRLSGDKTVLRSVLTAPAFLSGLGENELEQVRVAAAKAADPDKWAKVETLRKGWAATEKAVAAAVRAVQEALVETQQATGDRKLPEPDPENAARVMEALRRSGHDPVLVNPETNRERVEEALRRPENAERLGLGDEADEAA
jgi:hypothetical protein